ncbi:hypothetical protein V8J88_22690 [Massilia sp. W12]|uniref:hypothetical protein n=1 Tax=Massilia sp. W12 TaxID=3126507 RepID=UPI0030CFDDCC
MFYEAPQHFLGNAQASGSIFESSQPFMLAYEICKIVEKFSRRMLQNAIKRAESLSRKKIGDQIL